MHGILLVRVSTSAQDIEPQIADLKKFAKAKNYSKLKIIETKESGLANLRDRKGLEELKKYIEENLDCRTVFITELSRLSRRQSILHEIKEYFIEKKVQLFIKDVNFALFDDYGKVNVAAEMAFALFGITAESEIKNKKDRFNRARKSLQEAGIFVGGKILFGYKTIELENGRKKLVIDSENANIVRQIFSWYLNGFGKGEENVSISMIQRKCLEMNYPKYTKSKRNVNKLLKEEGYTGKKITNNKWKNPLYSENGKEDKYLTSSTELTYPPIITNEMFRNVQRRLSENNSRVEKSSKHITILSRKILCGDCNFYLTADYRMVKRLNKSTYRCKNTDVRYKCKNKKSISLPMLDSIIWNFLKSDLPLMISLIKERKVENIDYSTRKENLANEIKKIDLDINEVKKAIKTSLSTIREGFSEIMSDFDKKLNQLNKQKKKLESKKLQIEENERQYNNHLENFKNLESDIKLIESNKDSVKSYVNLFIDNIKFVEHNSMFTLLEINTRTKSFYDKSEIIFYGGNFGERKIFGKSYILIDKRVTQKIKAVRFNAIHLDNFKKGILYLSKNPIFRRSKFYKIPMDLKGDVKNYFKDNYNLKYPKVSANIKVLTGEVKGLSFEDIFNLEYPDYGIVPLPTEKLSFY